ncbi:MULTISPECIES: penicillin-binding protein 1A [unclassified Halanaerobium]|uniref:penicillin-binding protein 1A n=1 Tax=unclassified Halanaerobium TaxID=2641197 RepID=UPI000DF1CFFC|nr:MULTISPECIES: penicillin-binding protein 1A [unclassified Halanaerobium]RCW50493.1 penicillin-binding protein 1A [Halanaerobium sp. MA284_MarDTE_T2]RCW85980.1 penicillin-binding protein 1A [Halanaerobium sp. DL-01]
MKKRTKGILLITIIMIFALGAGAFLGAVTWIIKDTPDISNYKGSSEATLIYTADGELLTKLFKENRVYVPLERIPQHLKDAIIAIEDTNFYVHHGIDFWGIGRAMITNIKEGRLAQGASTITQQLARNALLSHKKTIYRKIQEAYLALQFERIYTKPEILEMYLNEIFLGHSAYGIETAAQQYFGKHVWELNLAESALIAGLPKAPNYYSPFNNLEAAKRRRNTVLTRMEELGYITAQEAQNAKNQPINVKQKTKKELERAHYFILYVRDQLIDKFGASMVYSGGLKVYTTIDIDLQKKAEDVINAKIKNGYLPSIKRSNSKNVQPQMSLITLDVKSGAIRAMIGGRGTDQFNRAHQALRQPGSTFKPFVYAAAIKNGYSLATVVNDMPMLASDSGKTGYNLNIWPRNYGDKYYGLVNLNTALTNSLNSATVKLIKNIGVKETIDLTEKMGITTFEKEDYYDEHYSLALGGLHRGVKPIEMASAYGVFANRGVYIKPYAISRVLDKRDNVIFEAKPEKRIVMTEEESYLMTSMLKSVIQNGTGWRAGMDRPVAGKTGTTNDYTDAWFVGYTPQIVTAVWIGEDNVRSMEYDDKDADGNYIYPENNSFLTISSAEAAQIWGEYMRKAVKNMPVLDFTKPSTITDVPIDPMTGLKPNDYSPRIEEMPFRQENIPQKEETLHTPVESVKIDKESGLLATSNCPKDQVVKKYYLSKSGIKIGPGTFYFRENAPNKDPKDRVKGSYIVETGEPVQLFDHEYGIPKKDRNGEVRYQTKPTRKCNLHPEKSSSSSVILKDIFDIFKSDD